MRMRKIDAESLKELFPDNGEGSWTYNATVKAYIDAQPTIEQETAKRIVGKSRGGMTLWYQCEMCNEPVDAQDNYCRGCGRRLIDEAD